MNLNNTNKIKIGFDYVVKPKQVLVDGYNNDIIYLTESKNVSLSFEYEDRIINREIGIIVSNSFNNKDSDNSIFIYFVIVFLIMFSLIIVFRFFKAKKKKRILTHKSFSHSIKILAVDIFDNLKKLDKNKREDYELKKTFRTIIAKLEEINNDYINLFFNLYELDEILDQKGQKRMTKNISNLKEKVIFLKREYIDILRVLKSKNYSIYNDMYMKLKHFNILIKFLDDKNRFLKR